MRLHKLTLAALAVAAGLSLTACQNDDGGTGQGKPAAAPPAPNAVSPGAGSASGGSTQVSGTTISGGTASGGTGTASGGKATAAGTAATPAGKAGKCRTDELGITAVDRTISGDPDGTVVVELKNRSGQDCTIAGYAGVDLKTNAGSLSATRDGDPVVSAVLKSGKSTFFGISYPLNTSGGSGVRITGLVVTPPDETNPVTLAWPGSASLPVTDGTGSPVKIGPMGSAGQGN